MAAKKRGNNETLEFAQAQANLEALKQLQEAMAASSQAVGQSFNQQAEAAKQLASVMQELTGKKEGLSEMSQQSTAAAAALGGVAKSLGDLDKSDPKNLEKFNKALSSSDLVFKKSKKDLGEFVKELKDKFPVAAAAASGAWDGFKKGLEATTALLKGGWNLLSRVADAIWEIGKSIIAIPFDIFNNLVDAADKAHGGVSELAQALNELREKFGNLAGPTNAAIQKTAASMDKLKMGGVSAMQAFGNYPERLKLLGDLFEAGGPAMANFRKEIEESNGAIAAFYKGLGMTTEQLNIFMTRAQALGQSHTKFFTDVTKQSQGLAKIFTLDAKRMSKDMLKAAADTRHFGDMSTKELAAATAWAQKLGISLDKLTGAMDAFDTFDSAAENISKLNETMHTNIDVGKIMMAKNPAEIASILQTEFQKAGVAGEKLDFRQRKLIQNLTGYDDAQQQALFSTKNASIKLNEFNKAAGNVDRSTMSTEQAVSELGKEMSLVLKDSPTGLTEGKGLFGAFIHGMSDGIQMSKEFQQMMMAIKRVIIVVYQEGKAFGKMLLDTFPGLKDIFKDITALFDGKKFGEMLSGIRSEVQKFIQDLTSGKASFGGLMENISKKFFSFFSKEEPAGQRLLGHFSKFGSAVVDIFTGMVDWVINSVASFWNDVSGGFSNPGPVMTKIMATLEKISTLVGNFITNTLTPMFGRIFDGLVSGLTGGGAEKATSGAATAMDKITDPIVKAMDGLWTRIKPGVDKLLDWLFEELKKGLWNILSSAETWKIGAALLLPSVLSGLGGALTSVLGTVFSQAFTAALSGGGLSAAVSSLGASFTALGAAIGPVIAVIGSFVAAYNLTYAILEKVDKMWNRFWESRQNEAAKAADTQHQAEMSRIKSISDAGEKEKQLLEARAKAHHDASNASLGFDTAAQEQTKNRLEEIDKELNSLKSPSKRLDELQKELKYQKQKSIDLQHNADDSTFDYFKEQSLREKDQADQQARFIQDQIDNINKQAEKKAKAEQDASKKVAEASTSASTQVTDAIKAAADKETKARADATKQAQNDAKKALDEVGPTTIENALERFKKIDEISKKVMGKDFDLKEKLDTIRTKLKDVNFSILNDDQRKDLAKSTYDFTTLKDTMGKLVDIGVLTKLAGDKLTAIGTLFTKSSPATKALQEGGGLHIALTSATKTFSDPALGSAATAAQAVGTGKAIFGDLEALVMSAIKTAGLLKNKIDFSGIDSIKVALMKVTSAFSGTGGGDMSQIGPTNASAFGAVTENLKGATESLDAINAVVNKVKATQQNVISSSKEVMINKQKLDDAAVAIEKQASAKGDSSYTKVLTSLSKVFPKEGDTNIADLVTNLGKAAKWADSNIEAGVKPAVETLAKLVKASADLESSLLKGATFNFDARLKTFTSQFGKNLGASGAYQVSTKDVVVQVNIKIAVDGKELEKNMITNGDSVIKQRLNLLLKAVEGTGGVEKVKADIPGATLTTAGEPMSQPQYNNGGGN